MSATVLESGLSFLFSAFSGFKFRMLGLQKLNLHTFTHI
jgi:hypothetical protein